MKLFRAYIGENKARVLTVAVRKVTQCFVLAVLVVLTLFVLRPDSSAAEVAAIKSIDIKPYRDALKGFKSSVDANVSEYVVRRKRSGNNHEQLLWLVRDKDSELVFTMGTDALSLVKDEFGDLPVIFTFVLNPDVVMGSDWDSHSPNFYGISMNAPAEDQFSVMKQIKPGLKRIGVIYDPKKTQDVIDNGKAAAVRLGITLEAVPISSGPQFIDALSEMGGRIDALWMVPDTTAITQASIEYMFRYSQQKSLPIIGISEKYVKNGALFSLSFDSEDMGRQAGKLTMKLLKGKGNDKARLQKPRSLKLAINERVARKLKFKVPKKLLKRAKDSVY